MANTSAGVSITPNTTWTTFEGTREELLSEGCCTEENFPAGRKRIKDSEPGLPYEQRWYMKRQQGGRWCFTRYHAHRRLRPERGCNYLSPEAWREEVEFQVQQALAGIELQVSGALEERVFGRATLRYDDPSLARIVSAARALEGALRLGNVILVGASAKSRRHLPAAKRDQQLQSFLSRLVQR